MEEESEEERESGDDSDTDSVTPERYERQAKIDALYKEQLGIVIEDETDEEEKEVVFPLHTFSSLPLILDLSGGGNS